VATWPLRSPTTLLLQMVWVPLLEGFILVSGVAWQLRNVDFGESVENVVRLLLLPEHDSVSGRGEEDLLAEHVGDVWEERHEGKH